MSGFNKNGKPAEDSDTDAFTDSLEGCINDALVGFCTEILVDDTGVISVTPGSKEGKNNNQQWLTVTFLDISVCVITQCSDHVGNEATGDGLIDYPNDPECTDYSDNDESSYEH